MSVTKKLVLLLPLLLLALAACAAAGVSVTDTPLPPLTLQPPPKITFSGACSLTSDLEAWLQTTSQLASEFLTQMTNAAAQERAAMRETVLTMAALRDSAHLIATPDCALETEIMLSDAMNQAVDMFQAYVNGDRVDLGNTVADVTDRLERVIAQQAELALQLEAQFRQEQAQATANP
ncbi:MAG TPA: hypothetical protein VHO69_06090 [Phototrophicaceae bacterium]|nr:hypothetical protein [Phototrophicaceae bacterium]